ncbi:VTT domain-containing protein [Bradyrhizobium liaoningense]
MVDALAAVTQSIAAHAYLAYGAVFVLAFFEAVPVVGSVVPGSALIIEVATLIPTGTVKMWPLMVATILGAILGDGLPYWLGHRYRETILGRWPLDRHPGLVDKSRTFIHRHGGKSIFFARFTPGVRGFVPVVAGMVAMPPGRFYFVNVLSAFAWAPAHILPGMFLGASLALAGAAAGRLALLLVLVVALGWLLISGLRFALRRGPVLMAAGEVRLREWSASRGTWLFRQIRSLLDPERSEARVLLLWAGVVIAAAWLFFSVLEDVVRGDPLMQVDGIIYRTLQELRTPAGDTFLIAVTELGDPVVTTTVTIVVFLWLAWQRAWRTAFYWVAAVGFAATLNTITKLAIHRPRPGDLAYMGATAFSFPSGHATVNAVLYGFLAFLITRQFRPVCRLPIFVAALCFATLIVFSRLYLGAHWFSDVVGSLAFATAWVVVLGFAYVRHHEKTFNRRNLAMVAGASLVLVGGFNVLRNHGADLQRYAVRYETPTIAAADWWTTGWQTLPAYRIDLTGEVEEPLTFQWAGTLESLKTELLASGWREPEPWTVASTLAWLVTADRCRSKRRPM